MHELYQAEVAKNLSSEDQYQGIRLGQYLLSIPVDGILDRFVISCRVKTINRSVDRYMWTFVGKFER